MMPKRTLATAGLVAGAMTIFSIAATAGECPADQLRASGQGRQPGATAPREVTDTVLGMIELAREPIAVEGRQFRLRRLVIQPGGEVPWHTTSSIVRSGLGLTLIRPPTSSLTACLARLDSRAIPSVASEA